MKARTERTILIGLAMLLSPALLAMWLLASTGQFLASIMDSSLVTGFLDLLVDLLDIII